MTHNLNHREPPVQKAGQTGTALPIQPLPSNKKVLWHSPEATGVVVRVAGGETVSKKTSTAALVFFRHGLLPNQRRAPRHPLAFVGPALRLSRPWKGAGDLYLLPAAGSLHPIIWIPKRPKSSHVTSATDAFSTAFTKRPKTATL